mgnify:FL=1|jgi:virulence-associated protein VapD
MPKKRIMINFDLDTKKYEALTQKAAPTAYSKIRRFMEKNDFTHRQGSCYISKGLISRAETARIVQNFSVDNIWFGECVRKIDISYIGKQLSLKYATQIETNEFNNAVLKSAENKDIEKELETTKDILDEIDLKLDK